MISAASLTVSRGERILFSDLSLSLASGEALALTGPNGAGKTSLLRTLAGFIRPDAGTIAFADVEPAEARANHIHWLGHLDGLKTGRRAREELRFRRHALRARDVDSHRERRARAAVRSLNVHRKARSRALAPRLAPRQLAFEDDSFRTPRPTASSAPPTATTASTSRPVNGNLLPGVGSTVCSMRADVL